MPTLRMLVAPCRSGTTAFLQAMSQNSRVHCLYQPVKSGLREHGKPDYSIYTGKHPSMQAHRGKCFVAKETLGRSNRADCTLEVFPDARRMAACRPVFLFREPLETWGSWKRQGWDDLELFLAAYRHAFRSYTASRSATCLALAQFLQSPEAVLRVLCRRWGLPYEPVMLDWTVPVQDNPNISFTARQREWVMSHSERLFPELRMATTYAVPVDRPVETFTAAEMDPILEELAPLYARVVETSRADFPQPATEASRRTASGSAGG